MNDVERLDFELAYYDVTVQYVKNYAMENPSFSPWIQKYKMISVQRKVGQ